LPPSAAYPLPSWDTSWDSEPPASGGPPRRGKPSRRRRALHPAITAIVAILAVGVASAVGVAAVGGTSAGANAAKLTGRPTNTSIQTRDNAGVPAAAPVLDAPAAAGASPTAGARGAAPGAAGSRAPKPPPPKAKPAVTDEDAAAEAEVVTLVNAERATAGCNPLTVDARLTTAARRHSQDMADRDYFDHTTPDGITFDARITAAGYPWRSAGENIAKGQRTPAAVMSSWMNSPGHRANILNCAFKDLGVGLARNGALTPIWTQDFGTAR
jgi:uncharacterized protein YkwD